MVRLSILNVAVVATFFLEAEAGLCRPAATAVTSVTQTTSTLAADATTASIDATTTLPETTTTAEPGCVETQLLVNPGFDDHVGGYAPWTGSNAFIIHRQPQAGTQAVAMIYNNGQSNARGQIKQTLTDLNGDYELSYHYRVVVANAGPNYTYNLEVKIGDTTDPGDLDYALDGWKSDSVFWSSAGEDVAQADVELAVTRAGEYERIQINLDSLAFTRVCDA
ncbi:hypothetical protein NW762_014421 [Fusarium torreyae]|uniref:CBM-cenC domain-containing protein n=1 Tax=Fusarium torreyae TaxID=1237075 RepID=A0A9W8V6K9_9HYPO|nr:hypothetical protein NW762_014421 [Fusarium torreyae]